MAAPKTHLSRAGSADARAARRTGLRPGGAGEGAESPWDAVPAILARIPALAFRDRDFLVTESGAKGDGRTDEQAAIQRSLDACAAAGGGRVVVPPGDYLTGPLRLRSRVNLHLSGGATLRFVTDSCRYLPPVVTRWEGIECMGLTPFLYAHGESHLAITGSGTLDGQAGPGRWWDWAGPWEDGDPTGWSPGQPDQRPARLRLQHWGDSDLPVAQRIVGAGDRLRPMFLQFHRCRGVLVDGVTIRNSPMWVVHPVLSRAVTVRGIHVISRGPNNDGCVPDSSRDVLVEDCFFDTGDDCVAIKAGRNRDGRRVNTPAEDIVIRGCRMRNGHSAVAIGSEISGGIRRVFVERCALDGPGLDHIVRIKGNSARGGMVERIHLRDIAATEAREAAVKIDLRYDETVEQGEHWPQVRDVTVERVACGHSGRAIWIAGLPERAVRGVRVRDCNFRQTDAPDLLQHAEVCSNGLAGVPPIQASHGDPCDPAARASGPAEGAA